MSFRCIQWAYSQTLKPHTKYVLVTLADYHDHKNPEFEVWPSIKHLSLKSGYDRASIIRSLNVLESKGLIMRKHGCRNSTTYILNVVLPNTCTMSQIATSEVAKCDFWRSQNATPTINREPLNEPASLKTFTTARCEICPVAHDWKVREVYVDYSQREMVCPDWRKNLKLQSNGNGSK